MTSTPTRPVDNVVIKRKAYRTETYIYLMGRWWKIKVNFSPWRMSKEILFLFYSSAKALLVVSQLDERTIILKELSFVPLLKNMPPKLKERLPLFHSLTNAPIKQKKVFLFHSLANELLKRKIRLLLFHFLTNFPLKHKDRLIFKWKQTFFEIW